MSKETTTAREIEKKLIQGEEGIYSAEASFPGRGLEVIREAIKLVLRRVERGNRGVRTYEVGEEARIWDETRRGFMFKMRAELNGSGSKVNFEVPLDWFSEVKRAGYDPEEISKRFWGRQMLKFGARRGVKIARKGCEALERDLLQALSELDRVRVLE